MFGNVVKHGEEECKLNALEACALRTWPDQVYKELIYFLSFLFREN